MSFVSSFCPLFVTHNSEQGGDQMWILLHCAIESGRWFFAWRHFEQSLNFKNSYQTNQRIGFYNPCIILLIVLWWYLNIWKSNLIRVETFPAEHQYIVLFETIIIINYNFLLKTPNFPCGVSIYCPFWN